LYSWYWSAISLDRFPVGPDLPVFDVAITAGPKRSIELLQGVLGVYIDGLVGPETLAAVAAEQPDDLIAKLAERYTQFYKSLGKPQFVRGWLRRSGDCEKLALATLARGTANV
jgi:lysozyme family protein